MKIPRNLSERLATASPIATQIINLLNMSQVQCDVFLCGSSLKPDNHNPHDMDFAVVLPMTHNFTVLSLSAHLRSLFPTARIDYGKNYKKPSGMPSEQLHLWALTTEDVSTNELSESDFIF